MDTNSPNANPRKQKLEPELARYQRVLDAYHAHPGDVPEPSSALDHLILGRAQSALAPSKPAASPVQKRRWPMAIAASVATIGFATIVARHSLLEQAPSESAAAMQESKIAAPVETGVGQEDASSNAATTATSADSAVEVEAAKRESVADAMPQVDVQMAPPPPPPAEPAPMADSSAAKTLNDAEPESEALRAAQDAGVDRQRSERAAAPSEQAASSYATEEATDTAEPRSMEQRAKRVLAQPAPTSVPEPVHVPAPTVATPAPPALAASPAAIETKESASQAGRAPAAMAGMSASESDADGLRDEKPDAAAADAPARAAAGGALGWTADSDAALFKRVRELRAEGELVHARELLRKFQKDYPNKSIPADLQDLLED